MMSPEMKAAIEQYVGNQLSALKRDFDVRIASLERKNKGFEEKLHHIRKTVDDCLRECSRLDMDMEKRIDDQISYKPMSFWKKILDVIHQESSVVPLCSSPFDSPWIRENETFETALDLNEEDESVESMLSKEAKAQQKIDNLERVTANSEMLMSIESRLLDESSKDEARLKQDENPHNISIPPFSLDGALEGDVSQNETPSKQPMSIDGGLENDASKEETCLEQHEKTRESSEQTKHPEAANKCDPSGAERLGGASNAEIKITNQPLIFQTPIKEKKEETSNQQQGSSSGKSKGLFSKFKSKGNTKS